jgi:endoglucanase
LLGALFCAPLRAQTEAPHIINTFDEPVHFSYARWRDKVAVADGHVVLKALPANGGYGMNTPLDLAKYADYTPVLMVRVNPANTMKLIVLTFSDNANRSGRFQFTLPEVSDTFVPVPPKGSTAVSNPNIVENKESPDNPGRLDLAHITQYQFSGDWQKTVADLEIDSLQLVPPDAGQLADREAYAKIQAEEAAARAKQAEEEKAKLAKERQNKIWAYGRRTERSPEVGHVSLVAPDILSLTIEAQRTVRVQMSKYEPQPGDEKKEQKWRDGVVRQAQLIRNGKPIGRLQGRNLDWFFTYEKLEGDPFLDFISEDPSLYTVRSADDPAFAQDVKPVAVYRKTVPNDIVLPGGQHPTRHRIYLKLPSKIRLGKTYAIKAEKINVKNGELTFVADLPNVLSEAVHVNQIGFRPDDPGKRAFLSIWLGTGGGYTFPAPPAFQVISAGTGEPVFSGTCELALAADAGEQLWTKPPKNYSDTAVYRMDYSDLKTPGTYRVYVEGVGCSYPFEIGPAVWEKAFLVQMKGLYNQRSGVELGPPYTEFRRPRDFHPDDGAVVTRTKYDILAKGDPHNYEDIAAGDTGEPVPNAWGGYHDAGDWNPRRVTHMYTTLAQLEVCELYPDYFNALKLNIPPMEGVPDIITEALFEIDCFRRLQFDNGAVPYGIETDGDPLAGEVSWLSTQHAYVVPPNIRDSWLYAAAAARAAKALKPFKPEFAQTYLESAIRAFKWAEGEMAAKKAAGETIDKKKYWDALDARVLSSLILYDITGEAPYHEVFLGSTELTKAGAELASWGWAMQSDAAFLYTRTQAKTDPAVLKKAKDGIRGLAERSLKYAAGNAFNLTQRERGRPMFAGFFSTSGGCELVRAYHMTKDRRYLEGAVRSCLFQSGCNPNNLVYTTGLGANPVKVPLEVDARAMGQAVPVGLTVFGNTDYFNWPNSFWDMNLRFVNKPEFIWPDAKSWPLSEAYFDTWVLVSANEYVIDTWWPNVLVWGCLAARPELGP